MRLLLAALSIAIAVAIAASSEIFWRWDQTVYDTLAPTAFSPAPADVLIVAIDESSLETLGQWPWPRHRHAELIDRLAEGGAALIVLDILFTEPDRSGHENDTRLATAIAAAGNVILPVTGAQHRPGGVLMEMIPLPPITAAARTLGHIDIPLDADGVARRGYLQAGLGEPHWPHLALAALEATGWENLDRIATSRRSPSTPPSPLVWTRDHEILIPFSGPPNHFRQISYADVLAGDLPPDAFRGKVVLVGATAIGLGDFVPTPVSGGKHPMAGVEVVANVYQGLRTGHTIVPITLPWQAGANLLLGLAFLLALSRAEPRATLRLTALFALIPAGFSLACLSIADLWFPPVTATALIIVTYMLWISSRLTTLLGELDRQIELLDEASVIFAPETCSSLSQACEFLGRIFPLQGMLVVDSAGNSLERWGTPPAVMDRMPLIGIWARSDASSWITVGTPGRTYHVGYRWHQPPPPSAEHLHRLQHIAQRCYGQPTPRPAGPSGFLRWRIDQLRAATSRLQAANRFISETLAQATTGMVVIDQVGTIRLINDKATHLLDTPHQEHLLGRSAGPLLDRLQLPPPLSVSKMLRTLCEDHASRIFETAVSDERHLMVIVNPFWDPTHREFDGFILQLLDITPIKQSERQRREALSFISHDFRAPLGSILSLMELHRLRPDSFDTAKVARVERLASDALELADNLLHLMRDDHLDQAGFETVDLATQAELALLQLEPQARAKAIGLETELAKGECRLMGNDRLLERMFGNLLSNAIKYSPQGARIKLSVRARDGRVIAEVADTGHGIAPEELPLLFDRARSFRRQGQTMGTGLGLAFVSSVVAQHEGQISVNSAVGKGTVFELTFPPAPEAHPAPNPEACPDNPES